MILSRPLVNLRRLLQVDTALCLVSGLALMSTASLLGPLLQLPSHLLFYCGLIFLPIALFVGYTAQRPTISRAAVWSIIAINTIWVLESFAILLVGWVTPNSLGTAFIVFQALVVGLFASLQYLGLQQQSY
jgi:hypothetical protein